MRIVVGQGKPLGMTDRAYVDFKYDNLPVATDQFDLGKYALFMLSDKFNWYLRVTPNSLMVKVNLSGAPIILQRGKDPMKVFTYKLKDELKNRWEDDKSRLLVFSMRYQKENGSNHYKAGIMFDLTTFQHRQIDDLKKLIKQVIVNAWSKTIKVWPDNNTMNVRFSDRCNFVPFIAGGPSYKDNIEQQFFQLSTLAELRPLHKFGMQTTFQFHHTRYKPKKRPTDATAATIPIDTSN